MSQCARMRGENGRLESVVDKDLTASVLGEMLGSDVATFIIRDGRYGGVADLRSAARRTAGGMTT